MEDLTKPAAYDLNLLQYKDQVRISHQQNQAFIFDPIRKKQVVLTPEEFVRQLCIIFLQKDLGIGPGRIVVEKQIQNYQDSRFDLAVIGKDGNPSLLIECKSFYVSLDEHTLFQVAKYNQVLQASTLMITNGIVGYGWIPKFPINWLDHQSFLNSDY